MPQRHRITRKLIDATPTPPPGGETIVYDTELIGFGIRKYHTGRVSYIVRFFRAGRDRRFSIGSTSLYTLEEARAEARQILGNVARGLDPHAKREAQRAAPTVEAAWVRHKHLEGVHWKPSTRSGYEIIWKTHVQPVFGSRLCSDVGRAEILAWRNELAKTRANATVNRIVSLLHGIIQTARREGLVPGDNPASLIRRLRERKSDRYLTTEEIAAVIRAINELEAIYHAPKGGIGRHAKKGTHPKKGLTPALASFFRLLLLTGARSGEIRTARWDQVDWQRGLLYLDDSKTGAKTIPLSAAAISELQRLRDIYPREIPWIIPGRSLDAPLANPANAWKMIVKRAGLENVRIHDLRHTAASVLASQGESLHLIGSILGHTQTSTTQRYAHLADAPQRRAIDALGEAILGSANEDKKAPSDQEGALDIDLNDII